MLWSFVDRCTRAHPRPLAPVLPCLEQHPWGILAPTPLMGPTVGPGLLGRVSHSPSFPIIFSYSDYLVRSAVKRRGFGGGGDSFPTCFPPAWCARTRPSRGSGPSAWLTTPDTFEWKGTRGIVVPPRLYVEGPLSHPDFFCPSEVVPRLWFWSAPIERQTDRRRFFLPLLYFFSRCVSITNLANPSKRVISVVSQPAIRAGLCRLHSPSDRSCLGPCSGGAGEDSPGSGGRGPGQCGNSRHTTSTAVQATVHQIA